MPPDRIVAVGFLTQRDLNVLGKGFNRLFPVDDDAGFHDLLRHLEEIAPVPVPQGAKHPYGDPL